MATTIIKVQAAIGQTEVTLTANGGSGTASNPYTLTRITNDGKPTTLCSISVPEALTGNWHCMDGAGLETLIYDLVDEAVTIELGNVPTTTQIRTEMDNNSTKLAEILSDTSELQSNQGNWLTATGFSTHSAADVVDSLGTGSMLTDCLTATGFIESADIPSASENATAVWAATTRTLTSGSTLGSGSGQKILVVTVSSQPADNVAVWVTTDSAGTNVVAGTVYTDAFGKTPTLLLDPGTYYAWKQKAGVNFTNPETFTVPVPE